MENLKETGVPNLVTNEGSDLVSFEAEKRGELLGYIKEKREVRDTLLEESNSFKNKLRDLIGKNDRSVLKSKAKLEQQDLYGDAKYKHQAMRESIYSETERVIQSTVAGPLQVLKKVYNQRIHSETTGVVEDTKKLELRLEEENAKDDLKLENLQTLLSFEQTRNNTIATVVEFFTERGNYVLPQNIEKSWDEPYSYKGAKGIPVEIAHAVNESLHQSIQREGVLNIEDNPKLFTVLNETVHYCPDSVTDEVRQSFVDLMVERGVGLELRHLAEYHNLLSFVEQSDKKEEFNDRLKEKVSALILEKRWGEIESGCRSHGKDFSMIVKQSLGTYVGDTFGLNLSELERSWELSGTGRSSWGNLRNNIEKAETLEAFRPGITKILLEEFGIKEFRRYSSEVLIKQYDQKDSEGPYGVLLYSNDDHNGAFDTDADTIARMAKQLDEGQMILRIGEFDSNYELMKRLAVFNNRYGDKEKISYLVLGAHGSERSFDTGPFQDVTMDTLEGEGVKKIKDFFVENPEIVLASCSTGASNGIGQKISETYGATVSAPEIPTNVKAIDVSFDENRKPKFTVKYSADNILRTYRMGLKT